MSPLLRMLDISIVTSNGEAAGRLRIFLEANRAEIVGDPRIDKCDRDSVIYRPQIVCTPGPLGSTACAIFPHPMVDFRLLSRQQCGSTFSAN